MCKKNPIPLLVIVGPTASGKTKLAVELAQRYNGEIISADSMQIYRMMSIGTAKPTEEEKREIPHHMLDIVNPDEKFSVAQYVEQAKHCIQEIYSRGKLPILAGGTGLYIHSLVDNVAFSQVGEQKEIRDSLFALAEEQGNEAVFSLLQKVDPLLCQELHPNNIGRVVRALEVYQLTGKTMSWHREHSKEVPSPYQLCMIGLTCHDRQKLYDRINLRVMEMVKQGLLQEAETLFSSIYCGTAKQAIGYKELKNYFDGTQSLEVCLDKIRMESRRYAKRQLTWFRRDSRIQWIETDICGNFGNIFTKATELVENSGIL